MRTDYCLASNEDGTEWVGMKGTEVVFGPVANKELAMRGLHEYIRGHGAQIPDMAVDVIRTDGHPHNRLSRIAASMVQAIIEMGPEGRDLRCIVIVHSGADGAMAGYGYKDDAQVLEDQLQNVQAHLKSTGNHKTRITLKDEE